MFDFFFTEAFWMETLLTTIIAASAAIVAAIVGGIISNRKIEKSIAVHDERLTGHENSSKSRSGQLSTEHTQLSREHRLLENQMSGIATTATFLKEEQIRESGRVDALKGQEQQLQQSAAQMGEFAKSFAALAIENRELKLEILHLRQQYKTIRRDRDRNEPEL